MKHIININISKDTPEETLKALSAALKPEKEKQKRKQALFAFNEDIEKLHTRYEELFKQVKNSVNLSEKQIENECETLSRKYDFELELLSKTREVDYNIKLAEIKAKEAEQTPWRRGWWWRLIFRPLTNRAQDIIEERAALDAAVVHKREEKAIEDKRKELSDGSDKKLSKRKLKRIMRDKLQEIIKKADDADVREAFSEPAVQENADAGAQENTRQLPGQMQLRLDELPNVQTRRPRPPHSCRKPHA